MWSGGARSFLDEVEVVDFGTFTVGRFGGSTITGAAQNDDGAFAVADSEGGWECAAVLDAHGSDDSASVVVAAFAGAVDEISSTLGKRVGEALREFRGLVLRLLTADPTATALASCKFETAVLAVARVDRFVAWLSVGDNPMLLLHPELARLRQYQLNQRQFFEWVGKADSLRLPVPCFSSGIRELREGRNVIALTTDGLLEYVEPPTEPLALYEDSQSYVTSEAVRCALHRVREDGRDSATIVAWDVRSSVAGIMPTNSSA